VLDGEAGLEPRERRFVVGEEHIPARVEAGPRERVELLGKPAVERVRLLRHQAVGARAPLLPHATRLDPRCAGTDSRSLVQRHRPQVSLEQVERDGEAADPGSDHADRHLACHPIQNAHSGTVGES
jgi:hypothetical protein